MKISGLIVAAGLSSRMNDFKPLMLIDNKPLIINTINSLKRSNIQDITVVVGHRKEDLEEALKNEKVNIVFNENYKNNSMYDSFKLGLSKNYNKCDAVVFLPGDIGFVSKYTIDLLIKEINKKDNKIIFPTYKDEIGHPPIISSQCFDYLLKYNGELGLKGGMKYFEKESTRIPTPDKFILYDMDYKNDFEKVKYYYENREIIDDDCMYLLSYFKLPQSIIKHCQKVKEISIDLGECINTNNIEEKFIDINLIKSAALLHDIKRMEENHAKVGADLLRDLGYEKISKLVESHMKLDDSMEEKINENTILYFSDKLVIEDKYVGIHKRFNDKLKEYNNNEKIKKSIMKKYKTTLNIKSNIISLIGEKEYKKLEKKWREI